MIGAGQIVAADAGELRQRPAVDVAGGHQTRTRGAAAECAARAAALRRFCTSMCAMPVTKGGWCKKISAGRVDDEASDGIEPGERCRVELAMRLAPARSKSSRMRSSEPTACSELSAPLGCA